MTETLAARTLAAIDETERMARVATGGPWTVRHLGRHDGAAVVVDTGERTPVVRLPIGPLVGDVFNARAVADARHVALNDPAAVLRRCAADRVMVEQCAEILAVNGWEYDDAPNLAGAVLRGLADGYGITE